jgi:hypothetical protein
VFIVFLINKMATLAFSFGHWNSNLAGLQQFYNRPTISAKVIVLFQMTKL